VDKLTYQATFLLPPTADLSPLHAAIEAAMLEKWGKVIKIPAAKHPIKDAGEKDYAGYEAGWHYIATNSDRPIGVVDASNVPLSVGDKRIYPGCWVRGMVKAFAWEHPTGGRGVSFDLQAVQYLKEGERFDGRVIATFSEINLDDLPF